MAQQDQPIRRTVALEPGESATLIALLVFAIAAAFVGSEAFRLGHTPTTAVFDLDEAVLQLRRQEQG